MSTKLSAFMGGLGIDARDKLEVAANATVTVGDGSNFGNVHVGDNGKFIAGAADDFQILHNGSQTALNNLTGDLIIRTYADDKDIILQSDDGSGGVETYFRADGSTSESIVYYSGNEHLKTQQTGVKATGNVDVTANVGIAGNAHVSTYLTVNNTNPAATDALVVGGNIRLTSGQIIFADGSLSNLGSPIAPNSTASDLRQISWVSFGYGCPTALIAEAPVSAGIHSIL